MEDRSKEFERIYQSVQRDLYVYIIRSVRNEDLAKDILQDSFVNFMKAFRVKELPPDVNSRMYIFRIARHLIINNSRSVSIRKTTSVPDTDSFSDLDNKNLPESEILTNDSKNEISDLLYDLLDELKEEERTAVILKHIQNMKLSDIAEILDTSVATASRFVHRGMDNLMSIVERKGLKIGEY